MNGSPVHQAERSLRGRVSDIVFRAKDSGFQIFRVEPDNGEKPITCKGDAQPLSAGLEVSLGGRMVKDARFGWQLSLSHCRVEQPSTREGVIQYLSCGIIKGIGPETARTIVDQLGDNTLDLLKSKPYSIRRVKGIGKKKASAILAALQEHQEMEQVMTFLLSHNLNSKLALRVHETYGDRSVSVLQTNPWVLATELRGVGFQTADSVAQKMGLGGRNAKRFDAALLHVLGTFQQQGHTGVPAYQLLESSEKLLRLKDADAADGEERFELALRRMLDRGYLVEGSSYGVDIMQTAHMARAEQEIAENLIRLQKSQSLPWSESRVQMAIDTQLRGSDMVLSDDQAAALARIVRSPISALTGGPGTGKTAVTGLFLKAMQNAHPALDVRLCAPTGKAAQRLTESTSGLAEAQTMHRLLEATPTRFIRDRDNPVNADLIIADESTMNDTRLARALLAALPSGTALLYVGDVDQLPSVGPGAVFRDLIDSQVIPVSRLTHIHRAAMQSQIVLNAHAINRGQSAQVQRGDDFDMQRVESSEELQDAVVQHLGRKMKELGVGVDDTLVLTAGHRGPSGTVALNQRLKAVLNPSPPVSLTVGETEFSVGDRVLVTENNYDLEVRNGMLGVVSEIDTKNRKLTTRIHGAPVEWTADALKGLSLGYAMTVHKAQGSQAALTLIALDTAHYTLLDRSLIYTAVTRASQHCVLLSRGSAASQAIKTHESRSRITGLHDRIVALASPVAGASSAAEEHVRPDEAEEMTP